MKITAKTILFSLFLSFGMMFASNSATAQCSVCASNVSGSVKATGKKAGLGLNKGIYVLLAMPYAVASVIGVLWYTNSRKKLRIKN